MKKENEEKIKEEKDARKNKESFLMNLKNLHLEEMF